MQINREEQLGSETDHTTQGFSMREKKPQPLAVKPAETAAAGESPSLTGRVHWRDPQGPRKYTNPPIWESATEGPNLLVGSRGSD